MQKIQIDAPFELKFVAKTGTFEGYASVFEVTDRANDRIVKGAFEKSLAEHRSEGRLPPLLWQHDTQQPIGAWREVYEDGHGLFVRGDLFINDIQRAKEAYKLMSEGVVTGLSIGYRVRQSHRDTKTGTRILTDVELLEVSMVTFPANEAARVARVKAAFAQGDLPSEREFEAFLREAGLSRKQAKGMMSRGYKSLTARDAWEEFFSNESLSEVEALHALAARIESLTD